MANHSLFDIDGKLYPPMAAVVAGSAEDHSALGQWEAATEHPELIKVDKNGKHKFTLNKGKGQGSIDAAYNPYMHSSNLVINDQFSGAYARENLVTVECLVSKSELTSGYHAEYAKDSVGWHSWHTGTVASAIRSEKGIERKVLLSRWIKPVRIIPDSEVASMYQELLSGTNIAVPDNVVSPSLLSELKKIGVNIKESGKVTKNAAETGDVMFSKKNNTKRSATSPLSGSPATQGSVGKTLKSITAAAEHLGIKVNLSQVSDYVKSAIAVFSDVLDAISNNTPVRGSKHNISAGNIVGILIDNGVLKRGGTSGSAYRTDENRTLRLSNHSARADNFTTDGENLSVVLLKTNKINDFVGNDNADVIEVQFKKDYLDKNPEVFKNLVKDIARFVVTGEYHDTAGAKRYNISGSEEFRTRMTKRLAADEETRKVMRSKKDKPAVSAYSERYGTEITSQAQEDRAKAQNKNAAETGDVKSSKKNNTKIESNPPLSGSSEITEGEVRTLKSKATVASNLGIELNLPRFSESVNRALTVFSDIVESIENSSPMTRGNKPMTASRLEGILVKEGVLHRSSGSGTSAYRTDGDHTLRVSDHSARADNFATSGENLSVVLLKTNKTNRFNDSDSADVIEVQFKKDYLDRNPEAFKNLIKDMARFVATGEYHDTAGAKNYNISGSETFRTEAAKRLAEDEKARSAAAKDTVKRSRKDVPATNMDSTGKQLSEGQQSYFKDSVVRDDAGNLLVVYHGTDADFTVFDIMRAGKNGRAEGYGFYFSDDREITGKYGDNQMEVYLNITKPLYSDRRTLTKAELRKFTDAVISGEMQTDDIEWRDSFISNYIDTYSGITRSSAVQRFVNQIWEANENDQDLIYEIANGSGLNYSVKTMKEFYKTLTDSIGVDGNISTWTHADGESKVYVAFSPERAKRVDNQEPTSNPDIRYSKKDKPRRIVPTPEEAKALDERLKAREAEKAAQKLKERDEMIKRLVYTSPGFAPYRSVKDNLSSMADQYGRIPQGESPARDVTVPVSTDGETKVRRTVRTAMEAEATPKEMIPHIEESIVEGNFNYKQKKNAKTMEAAREWVERRGDVTKAYEDWISEKNRRLNADMIARGFIIYNNLSNAYVNAKTETERTALREKAISILQDISVMGTVAGQTAQAIRLLKQQSPESQYYALERSVRKLQDGINERYGDKRNDAPKIEIDKERAAKWIQALRESITLDSRKSNPLRTNTERLRLV